MKDERKKTVSCFLPTDNETKISLLKKPINVKEIINLSAELELGVTVDLILYCPILSLHKSGKLGFIMLCRFSQGHTVYY